MGSADRTNVVPCTFADRRRDILMSDACSIEHSAFVSDLNRQVRRRKTDGCRHRDGENRIPDLVQEFVPHSHIPPVSNMDTSGRQNSWQAHPDDSRFKKRIVAFKAYGRSMPFLKTRMAWPAPPAAQGSVGEFSRPFQGPQRGNAHPGP